jgi:hypothetical protein
MCQKAESKGQLAMNAKLLFPAFLLASLLPALAEERQTEFDAFAPVKTSTEWKPKPALWRNLLSVRRDFPTVSIGKADFVLTGPLVQMIRRPSGWSDLSLGQKIMALPVVNLLVPQSMPAPASGGKYFAWGESSQSWISVTGGAYPGTGRFIRADNHEPNALVSFGW